jgi:hypothetical protein
VLHQEIIDLLRKKISHKLDPWGGRWDDTVLSHSFHSREKGITSVLKLLCY